jgi:NodT family efflux transporter outer membrane factor (OMF) lipoprotein
MTLTSLLFGCTATLMLCSCAKIQTMIPQSEKPVARSLQCQAENLWWQSFNDPLMDILIDELFTQNLDIQIAQTRVLEARGISQTAKSGFFPEISATGGVSRGNKQIGFDKPLSIAQGGFDAAWEIDTFGQTQALVDSSERRVESHMASTENVVNSVIAELVRTIIDWRQADQTINESHNLLAIQNQQVGLIGIRVKAGLIDATFLARAEAERSQTATRLPIAQVELDAAEYKIERLLGKKAGFLSHTLKNAKGELFIPEAKMPLDISLDSVRERPDIRANRADLLASQADLAKAEADLWPRISIRSFFGVQNGSNNIVLASNPIWSLAASISAPFLNFGKLQGVIAASDARAKAAALSYENASLIALQETKTALSDYLNGINAAGEQQCVLEHRKDAVKFASERFKRGLTDMTDLTTAQSELHQATLLYIEHKAAAATAYVRLHKALGTSVKITTKTVNVEEKVLSKLGQH